MDNTETLPRKSKHFTKLEVVLIAIIVLSLVGAGLITYRIYQTNSDQVNAGSYSWQTVGQIKTTTSGVNHTISFDVCYLPLSSTVWTINGLSGISPALPAANYTSGYTWSMRDYSNPQSSGAGIGKITSDWWGGDVSSLQFNINASSPNYLNFYISGSKSHLQVLASSLLSNPEARCIPAPGGTTPPGPNPISLINGDNHPISSSYLGFSADQGKPTVYADPAFDSAEASIGFENVRIFGGTFGNFWDWQTGRYITSSKDSSKSNISPNQPAQALPISGYVKVTKDGRATPIFMMNIMTDSLSHQIAMLQTARSQGLQIKYVELGNELFFSSPTDYTYYFPNVQAYIARVNQWIPQIKADFPGVQIAVVGGYVPNPYPSAREASWLPSILGQVKGVTGVHGENAVTFHEYFTSEVNNFVCSVVNSVTKCNQNDATVDDQASDTYMLANSANMAYSQLTAGLKTVPSNLGVWVTEWSLDDYYALVMGSWTEGLIDANYALDLMRTPQIQLSDDYSLIGNQAWGALFNGVSSYTGNNQSLTDNFRLPSGPLPTTQYLGKTANGFALSALLRSLKDATSTMPVNFTSNPQIDKTNGLIGREFTVNGKDNLYFMNLTSSSQVITIPSSIGSSFSLEQYYAPYNKWVTGNSSVATKTGTIHSQLVMAPYSVSSLVAN